MKYICFTCEECGCEFAISKLTVLDDTSCPNCCSECDETGECIQNPNIVFDRDGGA